MSQGRGTPAPSSIFAVELLGELIRRGVTDVVVCPGSRSQALALAAAAAERAGAVRLHVRVDERSAAFFALGVARETGVPAPVIVTSGTAVANLAPAVFEAHEGRVPLLLLTADRPAELRGIRANQTTAQAHQFEAIARLSLDVEPPESTADGDLLRTGVRDPGRLAQLGLQAARGAAGAAPAGPVQLNLAFREPLSGTAGFGTMIAAGFTAAAAERAAQQEVERSDELADAHASTAYEHSGDACAVVIAGADAGEAAERFAHDAGLPLLAEVVSGVRYGREAITAYASLLETAAHSGEDSEADAPTLGDLVEQAIVFGHPTLTRQVQRLLQRSDVEVVVIDPHAGPGVPHVNPGGQARVFGAAELAADYDPAALRGWLGAWVVPDRALRELRSTRHTANLAAARSSGYRERNEFARAEVAAMREPVTRELLADALWRGTWPHDRLVLAASRMVRVLDALAEPRRVPVHANRGLAGIDGTVATAFGIAVASQADGHPASGAGTTRVLLGDLALLHDAGSLLLAPAETAPRIQLFVANDGGGTIFDGLEVAGHTESDSFERVMYTPQQVDLAELARAYGWNYTRIETRSELEQLLTAPVLGPTVVDVPMQRYVQAV